MTDTITTIASNHVGGFTTRLSSFFGKHFLWAVLPLCGPNIFEYTSVVPTECFKGVQINDTLTVFDKDHIF